MAGHDNSKVVSTHFFNAYDCSHSTEGTRIVLPEGEAALTQTLTLPCLRCDL